MNDQIKILLTQNNLAFKEIIALIDAHYQHQPTAFRNGEVYNEATENQGSARVFAFSKLNKLNKEATLALFAEHYQAVLQHPEGTDHQNIRQFMRNGWDGVKFEGEALVGR